MKIAIIGAGIFGITAAIKLSKFKDFNVDVFEKCNSIFQGATYANHNRHHYGFHYPRSQKTLDEINSSKDEFEFYYKDSLFYNFQNLYAISKKSNVNKFSYQDFMNKNNLKYKEIKISQKLFNKKKISSVYKVREAVYDYNILKDITKRRIKNKFKIFLNHNLISTKYLKKKYLLNFSHGKIKVRKNYDFVINACYSNINQILDIFKIKNKSYEYNLQQLAIISFDNLKKTGITVMDGNYPSFLPIPKTNKYLFAHVVKSQLIKEISKSNLFNNVNYIKDNYESIYQESKKYLPVLHKSKYHGSIFVNRVVIKNKNDDRVSDLIYHKKNFISILGGKVITCEKTSNEISDYIRKI